MERSEKRLLFFLTLVSLVVLIVGLVQIKKGIYSPFQIKYNRNASLGMTNEMQKLAELKTKDTDSDSLVDYDELYQYETSPYLADSDSDGYNDKEEIDSGNDPNCPSGKECLQQRVIINVNEATANINESLSMAELRETLKKAGVSQSVLDQMSDETLRQLYEETVREINANTNSPYSELLVNEPINTNALGIPTLEEFKNFSAEQVRDLLIKNGIDENTLNQLDDETIMTIFNNALGGITQ